MYNTCSDPMCFQTFCAGAGFRSGKAAELIFYALTLEALTVDPIVHMYMYCFLPYRIIIHSKQDSTIYK